MSLDLKSRECLIEDIKCLQTEISQLRGRFDVIVEWIRSEYSGENSPEFVLLYSERNK